jgi:hypothetical protein
MNFFQKRFPKHSGIKDPVFTAALLFNVGIAFVFVWFLTGCVTSNGEPVTIRYDGGLSFSGEMQRTDVIQEKQLSAMVKGSIYETGEFVSVYGTCLDEGQIGWPNSTATLSARYPNGSILFDDVSMTELQTGYFLYTGSMDAVQGTYLTEFRCYTSQGHVARAFGEWQNPMWVLHISQANNATNQTLLLLQMVSDDLYAHNQTVVMLLEGIVLTLGDMNGTLANVSQQLTNISTQLINISDTMTSGFNITWSKIDALNVSLNVSLGNLSSDIAYVAYVANASVDRNDSYLAGLLQSIASTVGAPQTYALTLNTTADLPIFNRNWDVETVVMNEYGDVVGFPQVECFINTTNVPPAVAEQMDYGNGVFSYRVRNAVRPGNDLTYNVTCVYT